MHKNIYVAGSKDSNNRLDIFASSRSGLTRSNIQNLIKNKLITVNSKPEKASYRIRENDSIEVTLLEKPESGLEPENLPLEVIFEDEHIIVVNKPPYMVVYPAAGNRSGTLMNALAFRCRLMASAGAPLRPGVVHRLDKGTSGVIVVAKNDRSYYSLAAQFKEREIEKYYLALVYGRIKQDKGEIKTVIGRSLSDRKKMSVKTRRGKEAVTRYTVLQRFNSAILVRVRIITGRTHQIRVHFASLGHPVLGDSTYGKKTSFKSGQKTFNFSRQMLHASSLRLNHPVTGEVLEFTAPMPEDMEKALRELKG